MSEQKQAHSIQLYFQLYLINHLKHLNISSQKGLCMSIPIDPNTSVNELIKIAKLHLETLEQSFYIPACLPRVINKVRHDAYESLVETLLTLEERLEQPVLRRVK